MSIAWRRPPALRHRNFRLFYGGQFISLIGTWMQIAAQNWLVYALTGSAEKLGLVNLVAAVPGFLLTAWGGVIADRYSKRSILLVTQTVAMLLAFVMFGLVYANAVRYEHIVVLAFLLGLVNAVDMPTRGAFVIELVGREDVHSAVALNSTVFNASRIMGPAVAGILVAKLGTAVCFLVNGISFLGPLIGLGMMRTAAAPEHGSQGSPLRALREGLRFIRGNAEVRGLVALMAATSVLLWGVGVLLPVFAGEVLRAGPRTYGFLMASNGLGALIGAVLMSMGEPLRDESHMRRRVLGGVLVFSAASAAFAWSRVPAVSFGLEIVAGWASIIYFSTSSAWLQLLVPDAVRGRVFGVYHAMFQGFSPLGSFFVAWTAQRIGAPLALTVVSVSCAVLVTGRVLWSRLRR